MNDNNRGMWVGFIVVVVIIALGLWWYASTRPIDTTTPDMNATSTAGTQTPGTGSTGTPVPGSGTNGVSTVDRSNSDVASIAESLSGASRFSSLFVSTGVAAQVQGKGPYTVFVPTDGSISQLPAGTISNMTSAQLKRLIQYHVISGRAVNGTALTAGTIQALSGDALNFSFGTNKIPMVNSAILVTEYKASNGVVYLIDNVLLPPTKTQ